MTKGEEVSQLYFINVGVAHIYGTFDLNGE